MVEAHNTIYSIHLGGTKMYKDLKHAFWWNNMKKYIAEYVSNVSPVKKSKLSTKASWEN